MERQNLDEAYATWLCHVQVSRDNFSKVWSDLDTSRMSFLSEQAMAYDMVFYSSSNGLTFHVRCSLHFISVLH